MNWFPASSGARTGHSDTRGLARIKATTDFIANAVPEAGDPFLPRQK